MEADEIIQVSRGSLLEKRENRWAGIEIASLPADLLPGRGVIAIFGVVEGKLHKANKWDRAILPIFFFIYKTLWFLMDLSFPSIKRG